MKLSYQERALLRSLWLKDRGKTQFARVFNARKGYRNLNVYRALEAAGRIEIHTVDNATTANMLYGMSNITFSLKGN